MHQLYTWVFEPGFFGSAQVHVAVMIGGAVAIVGAVVGVFTVMRGQSFGRPQRFALTDDLTAARG
jgi:ABC-type branched-subunit amino acid transport system permease subunit